MRKISVFFLLLLTVLNTSIFSGCWDSREINELGLVTAVGIDKGDGSNRYSVTIQVANPTTQNSSDNKGSQQGGEVWVGTEEGASLFDAVRKLVKISSRRVMWAHNNVVIIGESMAKEGIIPIVDYFTHNPELRMKAAVVVSKGDAKDYITANAGMEAPSGISFILLEGYRALTAESVESHMLNVSEELESKYGNPLISEVSLKEATMQSGGSDSGGKSSKTIELSGAAIFKKDKMLSWLSPEECRGISWIINETKNTVVTVKDPEYVNKNIAVETEDVKTKIKTLVINGMPQISVYISGKGDIVEEDGSTNQGMREVKEQVEKLVEKKIEDEIKNSLEVAQKKYSVDVLGFAAIVHAQNYSEWHDSLKDNWQEILPQIPVTVSVNINIKSSALKQEPMSIY
ncbi:MAG: Ger(x)C family spore germination protein, partial [Bacillota bacterium]|nr:Ger(x)C family spore germination protein [Bacillota bacterium]